MNENVGNDKIIKKKKKGKLGGFLLIIIFLIGMIVMAYPWISQWYYSGQSSVVIDQFETEKSKIDKSEIEERINLAHAYNETLNSASLEDPYSEEEKEAGVKEYARMLEVKEQIGHVKIPRLVLDLPIYAGTTEEILQKGVGHLEGTSLPVGGNNTHTVITAHRGLPTARLFTDLDKLQIGDKFYIYNIGETLAYQVDQILIIEPSEFDDLLVVPGHDYATLLTCTPYMINSHRLIVRGHRVPYVEAVEERAMEEYRATQMYKYLFYVTLAILVIVLLIILFKSLSNKKNKKHNKKSINHEKE